MGSEMCIRDRECSAGCDHRFRWHAIAKVSCSADNVAFDERDISAESCCRCRCIVSCWATTYNYDPLVCHVRSLGCEFEVAVSGPYVEKSRSSECRRTVLVVFDDFDAVTIVVCDLIFCVGTEFVLAETHF